MKKSDLHFSKIGETKLRLKFSGKLYLLLSLATKCRLVAHRSSPIDDTKLSHKRVQELLIAKKKRRKIAGKIYIQHIIFL